jgi:hypothetical protein
MTKREMQHFWFGFFLGICAGIILILMTLEIIGKI